MYSPPKRYKQQTDALISQANPVSTQIYPVLTAKKNVRLIEVGSNITWAVTQPTPLEIIITIDGVTMIFSKANPVSTQNYRLRKDITAAANAQGLEPTFGDWHDIIPSFQLEGRTLKVDVRITWAITQPTPLVCRVKWAKMV